jgi:hypothetical protein
MLVIPEALKMATEAGCFSVEIWEILVFRNYVAYL